MRECVFSVDIILIDSGVHQTVQYPAGKQVSVSSSGKEPRDGVGRVISLK